MLGGDERHRVLVIGPIGGVGFHENLRLPFLKELGKRAGVARFLLDVVAVQVEIPGVAAEAVAGWSVLVHAGGGVAVEHSAEVVGRHDDHRDARQQPLQAGLLHQVAGQHHAGIDALRLAGVDAVLDEEHRPVFAP